MVVVNSGLTILKNMLKFLVWKCPNLFFFREEDSDEAKPNRRNIFVSYVVFLKTTTTSIKNELSLNVCVFLVLMFMIKGHIKKVFMMIIMNLLA